MEQNEGCYQGWVSKCSRIGDSVCCFSFVASVLLMEQGDRGPLLTLLALLSVRIGVPLLPIAVKCPCTEIFLRFRTMKHRPGPTIQNLFRTSRAFPLPSPNPTPVQKSPNSVMGAWLYMPGDILIANTETLRLFCKRLQSSHRWCNLGKSRLNINNCNVTCLGGVVCENFWLSFGFNDQFDKAWPNKTSQCAAWTLNLFHDYKTGGGIHALAQSFALLSFITKRGKWFWSSWLWVKSQPGESIFAWICIQLGIMFFSKYRLFSFLTVWC